MLFTMGSYANNKLAVVSGIALLALSGLTACNSGSSSSGLFGNPTDNLSTTNTNMAQTKGTFNGCLSGVGLDKSRIQINFEFAPGASIANVYRNGNTTAIYTTAVPSNTQYIDTDLNEGQTYTYHCESIVGGLPVQGTNVLNVSTLAPDAPTFTGISAVTNVAAHSLTVTWLPTSTTGVPASYFQVFAIPVASLSTSSGPQNDTTGGAIWTSTPKAHITVGTYTSQISGLGDQMIYAVGVLACSSSDVCDPGAIPSPGITTNNKIITVQTTDDGLPPTTPGITTCAGALTMQAALVAGNVQLCAPYDSSMGAVKTRAVWASHDTATIDGTGNGSFGAYSDIVSGGTKYYTFTASGTDYTQTPTVMSLSLSGLPLLQGTNYKFYVIDTDPSGHATSPTTPVTIHIGDTTPPTWTSGGVTVAAGGTNPGDTNGNALTVSWKLATPELVSGDDGTYKYNIYLTLAAPANLYNAAASTIAAPANPCASDTITDVPIKTVLQSSLSGSVGSTVSTVIDGLSGILERTKYSVCVKALDSAGNKTTPSVSASATTTTPDITPPIFATADTAPGLAYSDSCYGGAPGINVSFTKSMSLDMNQYKFKLSTHSDGTSSKSLTALLAGDAHLTLNGTRYTYCFPVSLASGSNLVINNGDTVYAWIDACDNAGTLGYGTSNCTANTSISQQLGNITPPSGFMGLTCAGTGLTPCSTTTATADGQALVTWNLPTSVTGWAGFTVYSLPSPVGWTGTPQALLDAKLAFSNSNAATSFDCSCAGTGASPCASTTSCLITGLDKRRTYYFYAQVYDNSTPTPLISGITLQNSPTAQYKSTRTTDTAAPVLGGNFGLTTTTALSGAIQPVLSWNLATDLQYLLEPGTPPPVISYVVYRKKTSMNSPVDFSGLTSTTPPSGTGVTSFTPTTSLTYTDTTASVGFTYYYTMCAQDANLNTACTSSSLSYTPVDTDHPVVDFYLTKTDSKTWTLRWTTSDPTDGGTPNIAIYRKIGSTTGIDGSGNPVTGNYDAPTTTDTAITTASGNGNFPSSGSESGTTLVPTGSQYVNYLIHATNPNNSSLYTDSRISVWVKNGDPALPTITGTQISSGGTIAPTGTDYTNGTINALSAIFTGTCAAADTHLDLNNGHIDPYTNTSSTVPTVTVAGSPGATIIGSPSCTGGVLTFSVHYLPGNTPATGVPSVPTVGTQVTWSTAATPAAAMTTKTWPSASITYITNALSTTTTLTPSGSTRRAITVTTNDHLGNTSSPTTLVNLTNTFTCPLPTVGQPATQAWVGVPGDTSTKDFCLAKYSAKGMNRYNPTPFFYAGGPSAYGSAYMLGGLVHAGQGMSYLIHPEFQATGTVSAATTASPWISAGTLVGLTISAGAVVPLTGCLATSPYYYPTGCGDDLLFYESAQAMCAIMGTGFHLVTNSEWRTVVNDGGATLNNGETITVGSPTQEYVNLDSGTLITTPIIGITGPSTISYSHMVGVAGTGFRCSYTP